MRRSLLTSLLVALTAYSLHAQSIRPILESDSTTSFIVARDFLEYAVEAMELRPVHELVISNQDDVITGLRDQLAIYDMTLVNRAEQVDALQQENVTLRKQSAAAHDLATVAKRAIVRERRIRNLSGAAALLAVIFAIFK